MKKIWIYDIETLPNFFCVCFKSEDERRVFEISDWKNDLSALRVFLKLECQGLKGYNNIAFDSQIIELILRKYHTTTAREINQFAQEIINADRPPYSERRLSIPNLDVYKILHLDNKNRMVGLKWCEYMIDWKNVEDMPFSHSHIVRDRDEVETIISYCWNDVEATEELFRRSEKEIDLRVNLSTKYRINLMNASNSKIGSELLLKLYSEATDRDSWGLRRMRTERSKIIFDEIIFPYIKFDSEPFCELLDWFKQQVIIPGEKIVRSLNYNGFKLDYGLGGIHGSLANTIISSDDDYILIDCDVASLYPSIAVVNNLYPEHLGKEFAEVYNRDIVAVRLSEKAKPNGDKTIIAALKEVSNCTYGKSNDESWLKDVKYTYTTTINGQLMLTMLVETLLKIPECQIIQVNTDGITVKIPRNEEERYYILCKEWEEITNLTLEYAYYEKMMIRDVNNYISVYTDPKKKPKCKGAYEFEDIPLHKNKSENIIPIAIHEWFTKGIPIEETVINHQNILDFCIGARIRGDAKFIYLDKNGRESNLSKTIRYFISNSGVVIKKRFDDGRYFYMNVHPIKGKTFYQTVLNRYEQTDSSLYDINYTYYIRKAHDELAPLNKQQLTLF